MLRIPGFHLFSAPFSGKFLLLADCWFTFSMNEVLLIQEVSEHVYS